MKKFTIAALAICLAFALAAPVMAVDADFTGAYRVRGSYVEHYDLLDTSPSHDYMDMRFRLQTVFKVSDILSVTMRFDALDNKRWGDSDATSAASTSTSTTTTGTPVGGIPFHTHSATTTTRTSTVMTNDIDFDRAYMTIKSGIGTFDIGRMAAGTFGTTFVDSDTDADRIKFTKVMDSLTLMAVYQKNAENDYTGTASDEDSETYYLAPTYKMENVTAGALFAFKNDKTDVAATTRTYGANPYFVSKFGPLAIQGELAYNWGQTDYDDATADLDIKQLAYNVEASYNFGPASVMLGYAFASGENSKANETTGFGGVGNDWEKLFILTTNEVTDLKTNLGGGGNLSSDGPNAKALGGKIIYGGASFSPLDNLQLGVVIGNAKADDLSTTGLTKDDLGTEYDLTLNWKIYDNLTYTAIAAYLDAGDLYKEGSGNSTHFDDTYALFHQLQLSF